MQQTSTWPIFLQLTFRSVFPEWHIRPWSDFWTVLVENFLLLCLQIAIRVFLWWFSLEERDNRFNFDKLLSGLLVALQAPAGTFFLSSSFFLFHFPLRGSYKVEQKTLALALNENELPNDSRVWEYEASANSLTSVLASLGLSKWSLHHIIMKIYIQASATPGIIWWLLPLGRFRFPLPPPPPKALSTPRSYRKWQYPRCAARHMQDAGPLIPQEGEVPLHVSPPPPEIWGNDTYVKNCLRETERDLNSRCQADKRPKNSQTSAGAGTRG